jgi:hypothetical protein
MLVHMGASVRQYGRTTRQRIGFGSARECLNALDDVVGPGRDAAVYGEADERAGLVRFGAIGPGS